MSGAVGSPFRGHFLAGKEFMATDAALRRGAGLPR